MTVKKKSPKIAVVVPYPELVTECEAAIGELNVAASVERCDSHAEGVGAARRALDAGAEVIVSRGGTALQIARALNVPVVEIQVSPYDILRCLHRLREYRGVIGITGFRNVVCGCEHLDEMLGMRIRQIVVESEEDALEKITEAVRHGVGMIIGDAVSVRLASRLGIEGRLVASGREAIVKAIEEAQRIAEVRILERERSELMRMVVENSPDGILAIDRDERITLFNPAAERIFGIRASDIVGTSVKGFLPEFDAREEPSFADCIHHVDIPATLQAVVDLVDGRKKVDLTNRFRGSCGSYRWIEWQGLPFEDRMFFVTVRDVTQKRKEMEEQASLKERLFQSQKMETIGLLAGGVAHDFNNLLTPILGYSEMMMLRRHEGDPDRKKLEQIHQAADLARVLTMRLLAFGRKQMLHLDVVDVGDVVRGLEPVLRRTIRENIRIETVAGGGPTPAWADKGQIEQALLNMVVNAQDSMPAGGTLTIETKCVNLDESYSAGHTDVAPGPYVMLSVSDTGMGMDEETRAHIFEPFFTTKEIGRGTGLGLATVYGIVKQHGGSVTVYSEKGWGSVFKVYLPRVPAAERKVEAEKEPEPCRAGRGTGTVLVAEDNETVRTLACKVLEGLGYRVLPAESAEDCIAVAGGHPDPIDLLLTDVVMPGKNGKELYDILKRERPELKVLFMSGYSSNVIGHHGILDEGVNFLQKPFTEASLSRKVLGALGN